MRASPQLAAVPVVRPVETVPPVVRLPVLVPYPTEQFSELDRYTRIFNVVTTCSRESETIHATSEK